MVALVFEPGCGIPKLWVTGEKSVVSTSGEERHEPQISIFMNESSFPFGTATRSYIDNIIQSLSFVPLPKRSLLTGLCIKIGFPQ